ncbi:hypothetical protein CBM2608_A50034 [Cupriavidus taiwanensis]|uniref:hypothetical protein n=1 Tax=Cupriavidus taiwanensis TaxID=164546 RepID=UPI000E17AE9D|nr:hypothetical protein [Cupriavidus taiwanensis]SOZ24690.1 hypothetical protein CBM2608_A50034 [Cupriavidus taiwanensis]
MYKGTRHTGRMWGYKASSVHISSFSSEAECKAILERCKQTFVELNVLQEADFSQLSAKMVGDLSKVIGLRIGRGRNLMLSVGIPQNLVFAAPNYLLVAPKLGGLLARLRRVHASRLPMELRDLHKHLNSVPMPATATRESAPESPPSEKVLFRVSKDGTRTAFTSSSSPDERRRNHIYGNTPVPRNGVDTNPPAKQRERQPARREPQGDSALAIALKDAMSRKVSGK